MLNIINFYYILKGVRTMTNMDTITEVKNSDQIKVVKSNGNEPRNFRNSSHSVGVLDGLQSLRKYVLSVFSCSKINIGRKFIFF